MERKIINNVSLVKATMGYILSVSDKVGSDQEIAITEQELLDIEKCIKMFRGFDNNLE